MPVSRRGFSFGALGASLAGGLKIQSPFANPIPPPPPPPTGKNWGPYSGETVAGLKPPDMRGYEIANNAIQRAYRRMQAQHAVQDPKWLEDTRSRVRSQRQCLDPALHPASLRAMRSFGAGPREQMAIDWAVQDYISQFLMDSDEPDPRAGWRGTLRNWLETQLDATQDKFMNQKSDTP